MPAILHTADLHLGRAWDAPGLPAERLAERHWECFERLAALAVEHGALALVIAGDLFDQPRPATALVERVRGVFKRLAAEGVSAVLAPGTHDSVPGAGSLYASGALGEAHVFLGPRLGERFLVKRRDQQLAFQGLAWDPQGTPADFLSAYRRGAPDVPEVLVIHGEVGAAVGRRPQDLPAAAEQLAGAGADYVALGHRHRFDELRRGGRLWGAYPGTPFGLSFKDPELGPRGAALVDLGGSGGARVRRLPTTPVEWRLAEVDLGALASAAELAQAIAGQAGAERLLRCTLRGAPGFDFSVEELRAELSARFLHLEIEDSSVEVAPAALAELAAEPSVRGLFARRLAARLESARVGAERAEVLAALREGLRALAEQDG